jgi:hypothetical protein
MEDASAEANAKFKYINETFLSHFGQIKPKSFRSNKVSKFVFPQGYKKNA